MRIGKFDTNLDPDPESSSAHLMNSNSKSATWPPLCIKLLITLIRKKSFCAVDEGAFYYSAIRFQIFRVNRGTWLVNSRHVAQTQTSVYFGSNDRVARGQSPPWRDDITEGITYVITHVSTKTYVCFLCERTQAISVNPSSLTQCQKYTEPCHQLCHLCKFVSLGSFS